MYLGRSPTIGTQRLLDSIESQFNGASTTFDLRYSATPTYPTLSAGLLVSLGGVLQEPSEAYYVSSDKIVFSAAPQAGTECWILLYSEFGSAQSGAGEATTLAYIGDPFTANTKAIFFSRASGVTDIVNIQGLNAGVGLADIALQASGGRVGIGTTSPATLLHLSGSASFLTLNATTANSNNIIFQVSGSTKAYIGLAGNLGGSDNDLGFRAESGNNQVFYIGSGEKARIDSSGRLLVGTSTQVGNVNGGILQLGSGITFPATAVAASDANTLDDYEEGTWTPVYVALTGTLGAITYANVQGTYVKVGRLVTITGGLYCTAFAVGTGSGDLRIGGLPFTGAVVSNAISVGDSRLFPLNNPTGGSVSSFVTFFYRTTANGAINNLQVSDAATGSGALNLIYFTASYQI